MGNTNPSLSAAQIAAEAEAKEQEARTLREQQKRTEKAEAEQKARDEEKSRKAAEAAELLDRSRDALWSAPVTSLAGLTELAESLNAAIGQYQTTMDQLGVPRWDRDAALQRHPIMRLTPWLQLFVGHGE